MQINTAIVFEKLVDEVTEYAKYNSVDIIADLQPDFVYRAWWRWRPGATLEYYQRLTNKINEIRERGIKSLINGAIHLIVLWRDDWDDYHQEWIYYPKTWEMALDPKKWDLPITKEEYQCRYINAQGFTIDCDEYEPSVAAGYQGDPTNTDYQKLVSNQALRQIECGCNAIWIDYLWDAPSHLAKLSGDVYHPAVEETIKGCNKIAAMIKKKVPVGSWYTKLPYKQNLDFVTIFAATADEIINFKIDEERIEKEISYIRKLVGNVPIIAFIDWGGAEPPMYAFSQMLSSEKQNLFLKYMTSVYDSYPEIILAYPVHGGTMGAIDKPPEILSY